jgi:hypothetical protein
MYSSKIDSRKETNFINYTFASHDRATYASASAEANVLGLSYTSDDGQIGTSDSLDRQILRNQ